LRAKVVVAGTVDSTFGCCHVVGADDLVGQDAASAVDKASERGEASNISGVDTALARKGGGRGEKKSGKRQAPQVGTEGTHSYSKE